MAEKKGMYSLPDLPYGYGDLAPFVSEALLKVHHDGHHQKYVKQANALLEKFDQARADGSSLDMKCAAQALAFNVGGHYLHSLFWKNMAPPSKGGGGRPGGRIGDEIDKEFGSYERFQKEFTELANSVESSGWATLVWCTQTGRPLLVQIKDHDLCAIPGFRTLLVLDEWEHAYYLDYTNKKPDYTAGFWNVVNWEEVDRRLENIIGGNKAERTEKSIERVSSGAVPIR
jgi:Fe-Mn family superoxide dismutase